jgi:hypothetical protein
VKETINNICSIQYADIKDISITEDRINGKVMINAEWSELPVSRDTSMTIVRGISSDRTPEYAVTIAGSLKSQLQLHALYILLVTLNDGTQMVIGDQYLPIRFPETHQLAGKSFAIQHTSWHYPYLLIDIPGSGSAGSGL